MASRALSATIGWKVVVFPVNPVKFACSSDRYSVTTLMPFYLGNIIKEIRYSVERYSPFKVFQAMQERNDILSEIHYVSIMPTYVLCV